MDIEDLNVLSRHTEDLVTPALALRRQLGLDESTRARHFCEAQAQASLARQVLADTGEFDRIRELGAVAEEWRRQERLREMIEGPQSALSRAAQGYVDSPTMRAAMGYLDSPSLQTARDYFGSPAMRTALGLIDDPTYMSVRKAAERASAIVLPSALAEYANTAPSLAGRLSGVDVAALAHASGAVAAFARSAAMADVLALATRVDDRLMEAARAYSMASLPQLGSLAAHRGL